MGKQNLFKNAASSSCFLNLAIKVGVYHFGLNWIYVHFQTKISQDWNLTWYQSCFFHTSWTSKYVINKSKFTPPTLNIGIRNTSPFMSKLIWFLGADTKITFQNLVSIKRGCSKSEKVRRVKWILCKVTAPVLHTVGW